MDRVNGANHFDIGGGRRGFRSQNALLGIPGTEVTSAWLNGTQEEILSVIEKTGGVPNAAAYTQLLEAIRGQALNYALDTGTANAMAITLDPALPAYTAVLPLRVKKSAAPSTTTTPTLNVNGLGAKTIVQADGTAMVAGDLKGNAILDLVYDGTNFRLRQVPAGAITNIVRTMKRAYFVSVAPGDTSAPSSVNTKISLGAPATSYFDDVGSGFASSKFTCGAKDAGAWLFIAFANLELLTSPSGGFEYRLNLRLNGVSGPQVGLFTSISGNFGVVVSQPYILSAGDYVEMVGFHNTGATRNITAAQLFGFRLGAN
jgi:hypothetical protein